ncbi:peptidoglycan DD-metalloendopeptidase family protein [bacterium]|nr:peptidoglycan DD-metalloendopeptidase family protein [bacterium]
MFEAPKIPFVIENLGVRFGPWDRNTNRAGDFLFPNIANVTKIIGEFGQAVLDPDFNVKYLPTLDFIIRVEAPIIAIAEGEVSRHYFQEGSADYEIGIRSLNDPNYEVGYDHLVNIQVEMGQTITPGDTIGYPRPLFSGLGSFEIMVNNAETGLSYCPFCCFNPDKTEEYQNKLLQLIADWETFKGDTTIYDESAFVLPGCLMESMVSY